MNSSAAAAKAWDTTSGASPSAGPVPGSGGRRSVLVVVPTRGVTFVEEDIRILSESYRVDVFSRSDFESLRQLLPALVRQLARGHYSLVYVWFAEPYDSPYIVLLARLFRAKCAIVVGGYDVASLPSLGYGSLTTRADRWKVRIALWGAHILLPTSLLLEQEVYSLGRRRNVRVIYPGVDCSYFTPGVVRKEPLVVTVGTVAETTWRVKGLDVFAQCSRLLPAVQFAILGMCADGKIAAELQALGGPNLAVVGRRLSREELLPWYQRASVYAQLSARESFGLALAESMACGCIPVTTNVGSLPEVVGDTGFLVDHGDPAAAAAAITQALISGVGSAARNRVQEQFPSERRERELTDVVASVLGATE